MEEGVIFTQDKKEIDVFFLKPQSPRTLMESDFLPPLTDDVPLPWSAFNEQDVNENSAGGGHVHDSEGVLKEIKGCCPVGHKGETGWKGYNNLYEAIFDTIRSFQNTQLNIASETAQEVLAMSIEGKVKHFYDER